MKIGVAYYPEQWPEERWPQDARLMRDAGVDFVRMGEFAWAALEPRRLQYDMEWLSRAIDAMADQSIRVVLCTPTAAPPAWLFVRHPSMTPVDADGRPWHRGSRRDACLNNRPYRRYVRRIVREVVKNFADRREIIGWQIDNLIGSTASGECYCDDCEQSFREWLQRRYGMIDRLNKLWGTAFWGQRFNDWHEIPVPRRTPERPHPSLLLDYKRFITASVRDFIAEQREIIEQYSPNPAPITTNSLGIFTPHVDQFVLGSATDVAGVTNYPIDEEGLDRAALLLDLARSAKGKRFWAIEHQSGPTHMHRRRIQPRPGQVRLWSFQSAARGADFINYFQWRTPISGQEMHCYGLLGPDGAPSRHLDDLRITINDLKDNAAKWEGTMPDARVAILLDYLSCWALQADSMAAHLPYMDHLRSIYAMLRRRGLAVDFIHPESDPAPYSLVIAPMFVVAHERMAAPYKAFVEKGGVFLVTPPVGYRTEHNTWQVTPAPPGPLGELLGVQVVEHDLLGRDETCSVAYAGADYTGTAICLSLQVQDAEAVAAFGPECYSGQPAITRRRAGQGSAWLLATVPQRELQERVLTDALDAAGLAAHPWAQDALEIIPLRATDGAPAGTFVLNHGTESLRLFALGGAAGTPIRNLLTDKPASAELVLGPCEVALIAP